MAKILIVDDEDSVRQSVGKILRYAKYETLEAENGRKALLVLDQDADVDVVLCDVKMPLMDGLECLSAMVEKRPGLHVIMISGHGTIETAVEATKRGAFDFIEKPLDQDRLILTVRNALENATLKSQTVKLRAELIDRWRILGESGLIKQIRATIDRIAATDARVLITGENGTGKELIARNLHALSNRIDAPFVDVNCAAIPTELIESELFGHEKGAFTGADKAKTGRFEQADGGSLFLDEIGDMDLTAQAKVLRALETGEIQRVGSSASKTVDVRVISATNKDLDEEVQAGNFREDLLYRLNVIPLHSPPLRDRPEDLSLLLSRFTREICHKYDMETKIFSNEAILYLQQLTWPGNVRELRNFAERCILLTPKDSIEKPDLELLTSKTQEVYGDGIFAIPSFEEFKAQSEKLFLQKKLEENGWNVKRTAEALGMQRSNLYKKIDRYNLK